LPALAAHVKETRKRGSPTPAEAGRGDIAEGEIAQADQ